MKSRLALLVVSVVCTFGCGKNTGCTEFGSDNYDPEAVVNDGSCILARDKFIGAFTASSNCFDQPYQTAIAEGNNDSEVTISVLADSLNNIEANVFGQNITIDDQLIAVGTTIEGAGVSISNDTVSLSYRITRLHNGVETVVDCFETLTR